MTINIEYETDQELGIDYAALASQVADKVLEMEKCPYDGQVNLVLTDNEEIKRVNTEFRNIQAPTDVLSFPMILSGRAPIQYSWNRGFMIWTVICWTRRMSTALPWKAPPGCSRF